MSIKTESAFIVHDISVYISCRAHGVLDQCAVSTRMCVTALLQLEPDSQFLYVLYIILLPVA